APHSMVLYLQKNWMNATHLWSAVARLGRNIHELSDTNMLIEAWHHILKTHLLQGKRNRCGDHLIYTLVREAVPRYAQKYIHRLLGMDGGDLEDRKYLEIMR
ncbi:hypothetical protein SCHPADRAFT_804574, partial [Schizopora paradoxa]